MENFAYIREFSLFENNPKVKIYFPYFSFNFTLKWLKFFVMTQNYGAQKYAQIFEECHIVVVIKNIEI